MRNYLVLTPVRGLPRADQARDPVAAGEVVALPPAKAVELGVIQAVEPSDAAETVLLVWPDYSSNGTIVGGPDADRDSLVAAIEALGGIVFFVGDGLPDRAEDVLADFSNDQLIDELITRLGEGRLQPSLLSGIVEVEDASSPAGPAQVHEAEDAGGRGSEASILTSGSALATHVPTAEGQKPVEDDVSPKATRKKAVAK